jgi:phage shock protein PspC (stress-responsive transcriptional regulator)
MVGGVCSGLAEGFHVEPLWVRLAFVLLAFVQGIGLLLYVVLWVLMPERTGYRPAGQTVFESMSNDVKRAWADVRTQFRGARPVTPPTASATAQAAPAAGPDVSASSRVAPSVPPSSGPPQPASRTPTFILGAILVAIGVAFLAANLHILTWSVIWPVALVALGIALLVRNLEKRS